MRQLAFEEASDQRGLVSLVQLQTLGITARQRARLLEEGSLVTLSRKVYVAGGVALDDRCRILAGCLDTGGVASHETAAALHGLPGFEISALPEVLVAGRKGRYVSELARVHTTTSLPADDVLEVDGLPLTSVARTILLLAGAVPSVSTERVRGAIDDAIRMRLASEPWLWWRLERLRCSGRNGVAVLESILIERIGGRRTESWLEREYLRVSDSAGLPRPECQARIAKRGAFLARVDFAYPAGKVVIEVTGAVAHATPAQRASDARRRNELITAGHLVLEFTYEQVVGCPEDIVQQVRAALRVRRAA